MTLVSGDCVYSTTSLPLISSSFHTARGFWWFFSYVYHHSTITIFCPYSSKFLMNFLLNLLSFYCYLLPSIQQQVPEAISRFLQLLGCCDDRAVSRHPHCGARATRVLLSVRRGVVALALCHSQPADSVIMSRRLVPSQQQVCYVCANDGLKAKAQEGIKRQHTQTCISVLQPVNFRPQLWENDRNMEQDAHKHKAPIHS